MFHSALWKRHLLHIVSWARLYHLVHSLVTQTIIHFPALEQWNECTIHNYMHCMFRLNSNHQLRYSQRCVLQVYCMVYCSPLPMQRARRARSKVGWGQSIPSAEQPLHAGQVNEHCITWWSELMPKLLRAQYKFTLSTELKYGSRGLLLPLKIIRILVGTFPCPQIYNSAQEC